MEGKIFAAIPKVMKAIGSIGKDRKSATQGYSFRGIDDLYNAASEALIAHEVFIVPVVLDMKREERQTKSGGGLLYTILTIKYTFYASDGSHFEAITIGEAMDSGDKSCNKAMSAAQKYAFLQVFAIPTEEPKDTENETHEVKKKEDKKPPKQEAKKDEIQEFVTGKTAKGACITPGQAKILSRKAEALKVDLVGHLQHPIEQLDAALYDDVKRWVEAQGGAK